jgi:HEAT repeat protein
VVNAVRDDYLLWLSAIRHKGQEPAAKDKEWLAKFEKASSAESLLGNKATYLVLQRIGGPPAASAVLQALRAKNGGLRAAGAESGEKGSWGREACQELAKIAVSDENDRAQQAALRTLGTWANWHYPEAIEALHGVITAKPEGGAKGPGAAERLLAVEGLAKAATLAALGNFEDKKLWWGLVAALEDPEARVKAAALAALQKAVKDGFGKDPAKWQSWATQKCGPLAP